MSRVLDYIDAHLTDELGLVELLLHLAAGTSETEVETALLLLGEQRLVPTFDAVRSLVQPAGPGTLPPLTVPRPVRVGGSA